MVLRILSQLVLVCDRSHIYNRSIRLVHSITRNISMYPPNKEVVHKMSVDRSSETSQEIIRFDNVLKPPQDKREYRGLLLPNKMKVLLVSDPATDLSGAALSVEVGHMSDPDNLPGLAHFCEHMLFLGTEKYPNENDYTTYLSQYGGSSNASTYPDMTKYYFDIAPDKLNGALDRFAQFFIAPLFTESATDREINAVNSEHEQNLAMDSWRIRQVNKHLADPKHPYHKFGSGNKETLADIPKKLGINVRNELINFHKKWYSSNIMCLAVIGKETLNELENMVVSNFSAVENKNVELPEWPSRPFRDENYGTKTFIRPVKDIKSVTLSFTTECLDKHYKSAPEHYLSHLLGHEGKGSILSQLRKYRWCNELITGHTNTPRGFGFFDISVNLTTEGFDHIDDIVRVFFQYIKLLKKEGPQQWFFDEQCNLNEMLFRFKDTEPASAFVYNIVYAMQIYPLEDVMAAPYLATEWRPDLITELLDSFVPSKCRVIVVSQLVKPYTKEVEPWYKTKYGTQEIPADVLDNWANCDLHENLIFPQPNPFIPTDFSLMPQDTDVSKHPTVIYDSSIMRVWHKQDTEFLMPRTCMSFDFSNPVVYTDPLNCNLAHMLMALFRDQLKEYLYEAEIAGLKCGVINTMSGISVYICGYSDKQQILLEKVLDDLFNFQIDIERFDILKEEYERALRNFKAEQPYQLAIYYLSLILTDNAWSKLELLEAMQLVTPESLLHFQRDIFSRLHTECLIYGNVNKEKALKKVDYVKKKLESTNSVILPLLARQLLQKREYKLADGVSYLFEAPNDFHKNSCVQLYLQCVMQSDLSAVFIDLIAQIIHEPCYDTLRTKEQLGYVVFSGSRKVSGATGIRVIVQSAKDPVFVEERIECFLDKMLSDIEAMTPEQFQKHKDALITQKLEKPKRIISMFHKYMNEIVIAQYHFERDEAEVAILRNVTKEELITYYKKYIHKNGPERHALTVHVISNVDDVEDDDSNEIIYNDKVKEEVDDEPILNGGLVVQPGGRIKIMDLSTFKSSRELYPLAKPYLNIKPKGAKSKL